MRIGIDCRMYSSQFTGIGRYVFELTENLFQQDQNNHYILFFNEPEYTLFKEPNSRVKKVLVNAPHYSIKEQLKFLKILKKENLDLMHFTHFNAPIFYNRPSVVTIHDLTLHFFPGKKMSSLFHRFAYNLTLKSAVNKARKVITVSQNTKKDLVEILKTPSQKIDVVYEGVNPKFKKVTDTHKQKIVKEKFQIDQSFLLYTGVWRSHKNLPNLIRSFNSLKKDYSFDGQLVITGRADPLYAQEIYKLVNDNGLIDDVKFTGMVDEEDLVTLYSEATAYVFPSFYEGFGLSPLEAMQCGTPVVASNASCIPEVCGANNAVYFDPNSVQDMAAKINDMLIDSDLRKKLIANGLSHVKNFSWEQMAKQTLAIYHSALN